MRPDSAESRLKRRALLLSMMSKAGTPNTKDEEAFWKDMAVTLISKLYAFQQAVTAISHRYFDGEEVLFPDLVKSLTDLVKYTEMLVASFNDEIVEKPEDKMDFEAIRQGGGKAVMHQISDLVNMAKSDALDAMGEDRAATELAERFLEI